MRQWWYRAALLILSVALGTALVASAQTVTLVGAGATFPFPLYSKWSEVYAAERGVQINYQSIGSGGGIRQFIAKTVDFGASDGPMTDRSEEHTSELQSRPHLVCRLLLVKKKNGTNYTPTRSDTPLSYYPTR